MGRFNGGPARKRTAPALAAAPDRTKLIRGVHAACRKLGLDDEARRDVQLGAVGKTSLTEMDAAELATVLRRLNRDAPAPAHRPHVAKVRALWWSLHWLGLVDQTTPAAIDAFVRRQTGVAALRFLDHRQAHSVVDALKDWAAREGVVWPHRPRGEVEPDDGGDRRAVIEAIWRKLLALREESTLSPFASIAFELSIGHHRPPALWDSHELDAGIRLLGKRLRRALDRV